MDLSQTNGIGQRLSNRRRMKNKSALPTVKEVPVAPRSSWLLWVLNPMAGTSGSPMLAWDENGVRKSTNKRGKHMSLGTILIILLVLALIGVLPTWGYSNSWGYAPGGVVGLL